MKKEGGLYLRFVLSAGILKNLGNVKISKACIYAKRLSDINLEVLKDLIKDTVRFIHAKYGKE